MKMKKLKIQLQLFGKMLSKPLFSSKESQRGTWKIEKEMNSFRPPSCITDNIVSFRAEFYGAEC